MPRGYGHGETTGDYDGDGDPDLFITRWRAYALYCNLGGGLFADDTVAIGLAAPSRELLGFGVALFDAYDDGWLDLASANGHVNDLRPNYPYRMPAQLMLGGPEGRLTDVSRRAGVPWREPRMGRGLAVGDLDNDGRQDVLILSHNKPLAYFHNRTEGGRSLTLLLDGRGPNRAAIGARVVVVAGGHRRVAWRSGGAASSRHPTLGSTSAWAAPRAPNPSRSPGPRDASIATRGWMPAPDTCSAKRRGGAEPLRGFSPGGREPHSSANSRGSEGGGPSR